MKENESLKANLQNLNQRRLDDLIKANEMLRFNMQNLQEANAKYEEQVKSLRAAAQKDAEAKK